MRPNTRRILALDPGTRYVGIAVFVGAELRYYAVRDVREWRPERELLEATRRLIAGLIQGYAPHVIAYEKSSYRRSPRAALLRAQEDEIRRLGQRAGARVVGYTPLAVRRELCGDEWAGKRAVAERVVERYPELGGYLAEPGTLRERYWSHLFDAVAVGTVSFDTLRKSGAN